MLEWLSLTSVTTSCSLSSQSGPLRSLRHPSGPHPHITATVFSCGIVCCLQTCSNKPQVIFSANQLFIMHQRGNVQFYNPAGALYFSVPTVQLLLTASAQKLDRCSFLKKKKKEKKLTRQEFCRRRDSLRIFNLSGIATVMFCISAERRGR